MKNPSHICAACPRACAGVNRPLAAGFCGAKSIRYGGAFVHMHEEPCISGTRGSGTVFFSHCNLRCVFCQNSVISRGGGVDVTADGLIAEIKGLEAKGVHNINFVSPSHYAPELNALLSSYSPKVPVVYNSGGYDSLAALRALRGKINIYLPDAKYYSGELSLRYSGAADYFKVNIKAIGEMLEQAPGFKLNSEGTLTEGVLIRHLVLPGCYRDSIRLLRELKAAFGCGIRVSLMAQYTPLYKAADFKELNRRLTSFEYGRALNEYLDLGFTGGYSQEISAAGEKTIPDFLDTAE